MATFNILATVIANRDASPKVLTDAYVSGGALAESEGYVQTSTATDGVGSFYRLNQVPSSARISSMDLQAGALGSGATVHVGVFWPTYIPVGAGLVASNASLAINNSFFAASLGMSAATAVTNIINSSGTNTIPNQELPLWQAVGLASDPGIDLDIVVSVAGTIATQGYVGLKTRYAK